VTLCEETGAAARPRRSLEGIAMLMITAFSWGLNWPVLKFIIHAWPPFTFRVLSGFAGVVLLFCIALARGEKLLPRRDQWTRLAIASVLNLTSWMGFATLSLFWLDASEAVIIAYTMPIWAVMLAWPVLGERPTWPRVAGLALGFAGVVVLLAGQLLNAPAAALVAKLPGVASAMGTALMFAAGAVFTKRFPLQVPPLTNVAWQILIGSLPLLAAALAFDRWDLRGIDALGWGAFAYVAVVALCVSYLAWFRALALLPASTAATGTLLVPVIGVVSSIVVLGEPLGLRQMLALAMTVSGVTLASRG
jgi:probable blue pigment (indigoidine) exporter